MDGVDLIIFGGVFWVIGFVIFNGFVNVSSCLGFSLWVLLLK